MKLLHYELSKLFKSRILWLFIAVLLIANVFLLLGQISDEKVKSEHTLSEFMEIYKADPEGMDKYISDFKQAYLLARMSGKNSDVNMPENVYTENDYAFFTGDFAAIQSLNETYQKALKNARRIANGHISEYKYMGNDETMFEWQYQQKLLDSYEALDKLAFPSENVVGYDIFFGYSGFAAFLLAALTLVGIMLIIPEKSGGMLMILRASKNGRVKTFLSKTAAGLIVSSLVVLLFTGTMMLSIFIKIGLHGGNLPIQMIGTATSANTMMFSPFFLTVWQGVVIVTLARIFSGFAFLSVIILIASLFRDYIAPFAVGAVFIGLNYVVGTYNFLNEYSALRNVNFFYSIDGTKYISVWRGVKLFGSCTTLLPTLIVIYIIIIAACTVGGAILFSRGALGQGKIKLPIKLDFIKKIRLPKLKFGTHIARYELKKILTPIAAAVLVLGTVLTIYISDKSYNVKRDYAQNLYTEYMTELDGEWTEEKHKYLTDLRAELNEIVSKKDKMESAFRAGTITIMEYSEYQNAYLTAQAKLGVVGEIYQHSTDLKKMHDDGVKVAFFDDTGWKFLERVNLSYIVCAALILLFADVFAYEYRSGYNAIQHAQRHGRARVTLIKLGIVAVMAAAIGIVFEASQFIYAAHFSGLPGGAYTAISMGATENESVSVFAHFFMKSLRNVVFCVLLSLGVAGISRGTKNIFASLAIPTAVMFAPTVLAYFGVGVFEKIDPLKLFVR